MAYPGISIAGTYQRGASPLRHCLALFVDIWPGNILASPYDGAVGAVETLAAIIEADEEIIIAIVMDDKRSLYGIIVGLLLKIRRVGGEIVCGWPTGVFMSFSSLTS